MTKRLTATEKWSDVWFRKLSVEAKVLFEFIRDNCDIAGFWEVDLETASFHTGIPQELNGGFDAMKPTRGIKGAFKELERCYVASEEKHVWLKNFLYHQKNLPLNPENPCHRGILTIIHSHNTFGNMVLQEIEKQIIERGLGGASKELPSPLGKGKGKGKGKGSSSFGKCENFSSLSNPKETKPHKGTPTEKIIAARNEITLTDEGPPIPFDDTARKILKEQGMEALVEYGRQRAKELGLCKS